MKSNKFASLETAFNAIALSSMFRLDGPTIDNLPAAFITLCAEIDHAEDDDGEIWTIGEFGEFSLDSLIVGAFWAFTECHGGQYSDTCKALSALGGIFNPGRTYPPTSDEEPEFYPYTQICEYLIKRN